MANRKNRYVIKNQALFLQAFRAKCANITQACEAAHIDRKTYYEWRKKYPDFDQKCDEVEASLVDIAESALLENIKKGKEASIFFFLCNRVPEKWQSIQKVEHTGNANNPLRIVYEPVGKKG